jgi:hypothetical protein
MATSETGAAPGVAADRDTGGMGRHPPTETIHYE